MQSEKNNSSLREVVVLTAVYNDWQSFKELLSSLDIELGGKPYQTRVVVVDDGSPTFADEIDFSNMELENILSVEAVTMTRNLGNQRAVAIGIAYVAKNIPCDYLVIMDSDLEDLPEYVPVLLSEAEISGNQIIFAERTRRPDGFLFKTFYSIYKALYKLATGLSMSMGNFSVMPGRLVRRVSGISEIWNHFPAGIMRAKIPFRSIPSERGSRLYGASKMNLVSLILHGLSGLVAHADVVVVRAVIGIFAIGLFIIAVISGVVFQRIFTDVILLGWTSQIVTILGGALFQILAATVVIVFVVLVGRHQKWIIPYDDFESFIMETGTVFEKADNNSDNGSRNINAAQ